MPHPLNEGLSQLFYAAGDAAAQGELDAILVCLEAAKPLLTAIKENNERNSTGYEVFLESYGDRKINVIKELRAHIKGLGLKDAKDLSERAPTVVATTSDADFARLFQQKLNEVGGIAVVRKVQLRNA